MKIALFVTLIDFIVLYVTFMYQRGTLLIARAAAPGADIKTIGDIQAKYSPTWLGAIAIFNYVILIAAVILLWQGKWWYAVIYVAFRIIGLGLLPSFDKKWATYISKKYGLTV